jgi:hypothetical protein
VYDFVAELLRKQAEVILIMTFKMFTTMDKAKSNRKYKNLKSLCSATYDCSSDFSAVIAKAK